MGYWIGLVLLWLWAFPMAAFAQPQPSTDSWITNEVAFPHGIARDRVRPDGFETLHAEFLAGKLKIVWQPDRLAPNAAVTVHASADELGHWPARDWRSYAMSLRAKNWEATVPVDNLDVPMVYFASVTGKALESGFGSSPASPSETPKVTSTPLTGKVSPMRIFYPRAAGMEETTRLFWPFLEGFEEGKESWQLLDDAPEFLPLRTDASAKSGRAALLISLPARKHSVTVATTRVRGWQLQQHNASGLRVWLRAREGDGRVRFTLLANAFTTDQAVSVFPRETRLTDEWRKVDLPFPGFPNLPLGDVDLFSLEFIGDGPREFLVDDLQLLGPWKLDPE